MERLKTYQLIILSAAILIIFAIVRNNKDKHYEEEVLPKIEEHKIMIPKGMVLKIGDTIYLNGDTVTKEKTNIVFGIVNKIDTVR